MNREKFWVQNYRVWLSLAARGVHKRMQESLGANLTQQEVARELERLPSAFKTAVISWAFDQILELEREYLESVADRETIVEE